MADDVRSWHVPASTVQRIVRIVRFLFPFILTGLGTAAALISRESMGWFETRVSRKYVGDEIGKVMVVAKAAQATAHTAASQMSGHERELAALWEHVIAARAELYVWRAYSRSERRGEYIEAAKRFYALKFREALRFNALDPAGAAATALQHDWRPDR